MIWLVVHLASFTKLTKSQRSIFSFMWKRTTYYLNLLLFCSTPIFWDEVEGTGSVIQCESACSFIVILTSRSKRALWVGWVLMECPKGLKWHNSSSYIMPHSFDLFCHSVVSSATSNTLTSFNPPRQKYWGSTYPRFIF